MNKLFLTLLLTIPNILNAQGFDLIGLSEKVVGFINSTVVFLIFGLAVVFFMYHIAKYIYAGDDEAQRKESRQYILYGIIVLTIMFSIYGVIKLVAITFGISSVGIPQFGK